MNEKRVGENNITWVGHHLMDVPSGAVELCPDGGHQLKTREASSGLPKRPGRNVVRTHDQTSSSAIWLDSGEAEKRKDGLFAGGRMMQEATFYVPIIVFGSVAREGDGPPADLGPRLPAADPDELIDRSVESCRQRIGERWDAKVLLEPKPPGYCLRRVREIDTQSLAQCDADLRCRLA